MKLHEIREKKAVKIQEMRSLLAVAETAKRDLNESEKTQFNTIKAEVTNLEEAESRAQFMEEMEKRSTGERVADKSFDQLQADVSILKVLQAQIEGRSLSGAEAEYNAEIERRSGKKAQGIYLPLSALESRTNTTQTAEQIVGTVHRPDLYIEPFRNNLIARKLGVRTLTGLSGNLSIPKYKSGLSSGWVAENQALTASEMAFESTSLEPKHVGGISEMSRQLIQQSSPDIEKLIRDDLSFVIAQAIDSALINGGGANEPVGVLQTPGTQTHSLKKPDWKSINAMLELLDDINASAQNWLTSPHIRTLLRTTLKEAGLPTGYLLDGSSLVNLPLHATNQMPDKKTLILGDWSQVMLGVWGELDLLVNPYAEDAYKKGNVLIRAMATVGIGYRHPESFVIAKDIGDK